MRGVRRVVRPFFHGIEGGVLARSARTHRGAVALAGALATGLCALLSGAGALDWFEGKTVDARFTHARVRAVEMSARIAHVDIDDGAIASVGRWPWARSRIADAVDELFRAGAGVVALDLLFDAPQAASWEGESREGLERVDHDGVLGAALARGKSVVAVRVAKRRGEAEEARFVEAAREAVATRDRGETFASYVKRLAPQVDEHTRSFPEKALLERAWDQAGAWIALRGAMHAGEGRRLEGGDAAPVEVIARAGAGAGFVNVDFAAGTESAVREVDAVRSSASGEALQFGLVGATLLEGLTARDVVVTEGAVRVGGRTLPRTERGTVLLDWPSGHASMPNRAASGAGEPVSIGALVSLAEQRRSVARNAGALAGATRVALGLDEKAPVTEEEVAQASAQAREWLAQIRELEAAGEALEEEELNAKGLFEQLLALEEQAARGPAVVLEAEERVRRAVEGRLVFLGWSATGAIADLVSTPLGPRTPGVVAHAVAADMALTGRGMEEMGSRGVLLITLGVGMVVALLTAFANAGIAATAGLLVVLVYGAVVVFGFNGWGRAGGWGMLLPVVAPGLAGLSAWAAGTVVEAGLSQRERRRIERQFKARVSGQLVDYLVENPGALSVGGVQREATALFVDLAGFTSLSERLDGAKTVSTLNTCMRALTECLTKEGAYVNKFLGDGVMAFWSAFVEENEQATRACRAAAACIEAMEGVNASLGLEEGKRLSARIGLATGLVVVGDCGAPPELNDYTAIGNTVNLASRLESANKQFGTRVLIDGRTRDLLGEGAGVRLRGLGKMVVVGQTSGVEVFEVVGSEVSEEELEVTHRAVKAYAQGRFGEARGLWGEVRGRFGRTKLADAYEGAMEGLGEEGGEGFDGVLRLREK